MIPLSINDSFIKKFIRHFPKPPRKTFNIFAGTNSSKEWHQALDEWLSYGQCTDISPITDYENEFATYCGVRYGISFGAGRMALYAILEAMGIGLGDEVIIPAFTCVVVPNAILYRRANPVYVDIEPRFFNIDVNKLEAKISPRTKALYAQHTFGVPCNVDVLREIGRRHGLPVIEDGAHALGATYKGNRIGSLTEVAFFSTDHSKVINTYLGGMVVTNDDTLAAKLRKIQHNSPFLKDYIVRKLLRSFLIEYYLLAPSVLWIGRSINLALDRLNFLFSFEDELETTKPERYPYPCRLSSAQAKLGSSQIKNLGKNLAHRREIANWLEQKIHWTGLGTQEFTEASWLRYSFLVKDRKKFESAFQRRFDLGIWFTSVVSGRSREFESVKYEIGSCPVAESVTNHIVNIPTHLRIPLEIIQEEFDRNWNWLKQEIKY